MEDWLSVSISLWPLVVVAIIIIFWKQIAKVLTDISELTFGSFSLKLRRRISMKVSQKKLEKLKTLSSRDLKFFFVVASQSWKISKVEWKFTLDETLEIASKLEDANLIKITNRSNEKNVDMVLTGFGEEFYQELTSLIAELLTKIAE